MFAYLKYYYHFSDHEINNMSMYRIYTYMNNLPKVLGQKEQKEDPRDAEWREKQKNMHKIETNEELIKQAKELGLKTPSKY